MVEAKAIGILARSQGMKWPLEVDCDWEADSLLDPPGGMRSVTLILAQRN